MSFYDEGEDVASIAGEGAGDLIRRHQGGFRDRLTGRPLLAFILVFGHDAGDVSGEGREAVRGRLTGSRLCGAEEAMGRPAKG